MSGWLHPHCVVQTRVHTENLAAGQTGGERACAPVCMCVLYQNVFVLARAQICQANTALAPPASLPPRSPLSGLTPIIHANVHAAVDAWVVDSLAATEGI